jgi:hypothetical protein
LQRLTKHNPVLSEMPARAGRKYRNKPLRNGFFIASLHHVDLYEMTCGLMKHEAFDTGNVPRFKGDLS